MKRSQKSYLLLNKRGHILIIQSILLFLLQSVNYAQIANFVNNGGFEDLIDCDPPSSFASKVKFWSSIDTSKAKFGTYNVCLWNVPNTGVGCQWPKNGNGFLRGTLLCDVNVCSPIVNRNYFRNKLKTNLKPNAIYCVKFFANITNNTPIGIDGFDAYFSSNVIDTISYNMVPLTFINPQVQNQIGNIITDTLNWSPITGTFVANGTEKYMLIGNFKSDANTMTTQIQPVSFAWCDIFLDDVSCIDIDLPAYAGPDVWVVPSTSVYIGRQSDVGIDEACMWYQLPTVITPTTPALDTVAGVWVNPVVTSTYVVRQEICGNVKLDTVVVHMSGVGVTELESLQNNIYLFPIPAQNELQIQLTADIENYISLVSIYNNLGQLIREEEITFINKKTSIKTNDLPNGVYSLQLKCNNSGVVNKQFVIVR